MMKRPTVTYRPFDVVTVPFPFTDSPKKKRRPAIVLSAQNLFNDKIGHSVMAMITSAKNSPWPLDITIEDLKSSGLPAPSVIRMKIFTLDHRFIISRIGSLAAVDRKRLSETLKLLLP